MRPFSKIFGKPHRRIVVGSRQGKQKIFRAFAKTPPFHRCSGEQRAEHAAAIAILVEQASISANQSRRGKRQFFRARFYHGAKIRISAVLPPLVNLVGECLPQTLLMRPVGRERRSTLEEKIQHTPPLPCGQNPHDRGRIRRLYRAAETL